MLQLAQTTTPLPLPHTLTPRPCFPRHVLPLAPHFISHPQLQANAAGYTALHVAAAASASECIAELLDNGSSVDCADIFGNTPLHVAVAASDACDNVLRLLTARADPNVGNSDSNSALHLAAMHNRPGCLQLLLQHGAQPSLLNVYGLSVHLVASRMYAATTIRNALSVLFI
jgi:hypothetical protein